MIQNIISAIRNARSQQQVNPKEVLAYSLITPNKAINNNLHLIEGLAKVKLSLTALSGLKINLPEAEIILEITSNPESAKKIQEEIANLENYIKIQSAKLANPQFAGKAPAAIIAKEQAKLDQALEKLAALK